MQMLYSNKLMWRGYEQHTSAIIGRINKMINKSLQHIFIDNNHWVLVKIHTSTLGSHCAIYVLNKPIIVKLPVDMV
jgi:hypothetical protein